MPLYRIRKGTACLLRSGKRSVFMPHVLMRDAVFHKGHVDAGMWVFRMGMYTYRIPKEDVVGPNTDRTPPFVKAASSPLISAHLKAASKSPPASKPCGTVAPGDGVDDWRDV